MSDAVTIDPDGTYPIGAAARFLGVSASTLRDLERRGQIACTRTPGGQRRFAGAELLRLQKQSQGTPPKKPAPPSPHIAASAEDAKARQAWLSPLIARAQQELPADTPAAIRLRLSADLERALGSWDPASPTGDVEPLIKSLVQRARMQAETDREDAERHAMKGELVEFALARVRQGIDLLPKRIVGAPGSLKRRHVRATLRDQLRDLLQTRLRGDEGWDQVRELADEFMASWFVEQTPDSRIPNTVKFLAVGATGVIGGVAAAAALDPRIRAAAAKLKDPLWSLAVDVLKRFGAPPPSTSSPPNPPKQATTTPPPSGPSTGFVTGWRNSYRRTAKYSRLAIPKSQKAPPDGTTPFDAQAPHAATPDHDEAPPESPGTPSPTS
jgi:MerR family regulatory protein